MLYRYLLKIILISLNWTNYLCQLYPILVKYSLDYCKLQHSLEILFVNLLQIWLHPRFCHQPSGKRANYFWHQKDDIALTSRGYFWTYPGKKLTKNSICVLPEWHNIKKFNCAGICSDFIADYKL